MPVKLLNPTPRVIVGSFPPPLHGASAINAALRARCLARGYACDCIDLSPATAKWLYHARRLLNAIRGIGRILLRSGSATYVISADGGLGLIYDAMLAAAARLRKSKIAIYHHSSCYVAEYKLVADALFRIAGPQSMHIACSQQMLRSLRDRYSLSVPTIVVPNAAWVKVDNTPKPQPHAAITFGHLSNLSVEKGLYEAIATLREAHRCGLEAILTLAGSPTTREAAAIIDAAEREFEDSLIVLGHVSGEKKAQFYRDIDYFLFPSLYEHETQSLVVPESLAAGTPVIAYEHRFVCELIRPRGGLCIPVDRPFARQAIAWVQEGSQSLSERSAAAREQFNELNRTASQGLDTLIEFMS